MKLSNSWLHRAEKAGRQIGVLCHAMHAKHGELAVRRILGVLALAKKYGIASADDACAMALETGPSGTTSYAVIWNTIRNHDSACGKSIRSFASSPCAAISSKTEPVWRTQSWT